MQTLYDLITHADTHALRGTFQITIPSERYRVLFADRITYHHDHVVVWDGDLKLLECVPQLAQYVPVKVVVLNGR